MYVYASTFLHMYIVKSIMTLYMYICKQVVLLAVTSMSKINAHALMYNMYAAHMKCVVSSMVLPSLCLVSKSQMARLACGSIPEVGSSSITILEPPIRAIPTLHGRYRCYVSLSKFVYVIFLSHIYCASCKAG